MARSSPEKRRAIRKVEAQRDTLMARRNKANADLAACRATLKKIRRTGVG